MRVAWRLGRLVLGYACIVVGIIGLFLPILQGVLFLLLGLSLLGADSAWARRRRDQLRLWFARRRTSANDRGDGNG